MFRVAPAKSAVAALENTGDQPDTSLGLRQVGIDAPVHQVAVMVIVDAGGHHVDGPPRLFIVGHHMTVRKIPPYRLCALCLRSLQLLMVNEKNLAFHLGGHVDHSIWWKNLSPNGGDKPTGDRHAARLVDHRSSILPNRHTATASSQDTTKRATIP